MRAIVIFMPTDFFNEKDVCTSITAALAQHVKGEGKIHILDSADLAKLAVKACPNFVHEEDGDYACKIVRTMCDSNNTIDLTVQLIRQLEACENNNSDENIAFLQSMSLLSQGVKVSTKVARQYHYNDTVRDIIKSVYRDYNK